MNAQYLPLLFVYVGGALIIETIFSLDGLGRLGFEALGVCSGDDLVELKARAGQPIGECSFATGGMRVVKNSKKGILATAFGIFEDLERIHIGWTRLQNNRHSATGCSANRQAGGRDPIEIKIAEREGTGEYPQGHRSRVQVIDLTQPRSYSPAPAGRSPSSTPTS